MVIFLNRLITKQVFYMNRSFTLWDYAFWLLIIAMDLPFLKTPNLSHSSLQYVLVQTVLSFLGGLAYSALYVQTGSIWYAMALHFATDYMRTANDMSQIQDGRFEFIALLTLNYLKIGLILYVFWPRKKSRPW